MTKNIEDLLYRGDSLERMGDISSRLREDSRKYKKAAVRINWELLLKQVRRPIFWTVRLREMLIAASTALLVASLSSSLSSFGGVSSKNPMHSASTLRHVLIAFTTEPDH